MKNLIFAIAVTLGLAGSAFAGDRVPIVTPKSITAVLRASAVRTDTLVVTRRSYLAVLTADTDGFFRTGADTGTGTGFPLWQYQYYPDGNIFENGDTIVVQCAACVAASDTMTVRIKLYSAQNP